MIVCSQNISKKDSICFSKDQAKIIMSDLNNYKYLDSTSQIQALMIHNFKKVVIADKDQIAILNIQKANISSKLKSKERKLFISKRISKYGIPASLSLGVILGVIVSK